MRHTTKSVSVSLNKYSPKIKYSTEQKKRKRFIVDGIAHDNDKAFFDVITEPTLEPIGALIDKTSGKC